MTSRHQPEHDELLRDLVCGDGDPSSEFAQGLSECEVCGPLLAELLELPGELDELARTERTVFDGARTESTEEHRRLIGEAFERAQLRPSRRAWPSRFRWFALVAAVLLLAIPIGVYLSHKSDPGPVFLGESDARCIAPVGQVSSFGEFRWEGEFGGGASFALRIYDLEQEEAPLVVEGLRSTSWTPPSELTPSRIRWEVEVLRNGVFVDSFEAFAQRSP